MGLAGVDVSLDHLVGEVMQDLALAAPNAINPEATPDAINPEVLKVCGEANALVGQLDADDASATYKATQWLNQRLRGVRLDALSTRELDIVSGCLTRVESALARYRRRRQQTPRSTSHPGLARARKRIGRLIR